MKNHSFSAKIDVFRGRFESDSGRFKSDSGRFMSDSDRFKSDSDRFKSDSGRFMSDCCFKIKIPLFRLIFSYINTSKAVWMPQKLSPNEQKKFSN